MTTYAALLRDRIERLPPPTFGNCLDALRFLRERAIKGDSGEKWQEMFDALDVIDGYVYERATENELHERAQLRRQP